jgi:hypothetical protein
VLVWGNGTGVPAGSQKSNSSTHRLAKRTITITVACTRPKTI